MTRTWLGVPTRRQPAGGGPDGTDGRSEPFPVAARRALADSQLRRNLRKATGTIRAKRAGVVEELADWPELRQAGKAIKDRALFELDGYLTRFERAATAAGAQVHWAADAAEATAAVARIVHAAGASDVVKVKSMATEEIGLNDALAADGITAYETDLAELIVQLGHDRPSHILVPAIHKNRSEVRELFLRTIENVDPQLTDQPARLAGAAREHLRRKFLSAKVGVSGANFAVAETGSLVVAESEGNGRMCLTLPDVLISVVGIEKVVPTWSDLEVFLQLLPRSSTGERMNPYTTVWTGVHPGDGPREVHVVLVDNGRTRVLADEVGRQALRCIRCSACLNVCPVYERVGGHAYHSVYPGPIGAILTPQLVGVTQAPSLPYASSLCGACYDVCPVAIDIPEVLVHLRNKVVESKPHRTPESLTMQALGWVFGSERRLGPAQRAARLAPLAGLLPAGLSPLRAWTSVRDLPPIPPEPFRAWWQRERGSATPPPPLPPGPRTAEVRTGGTWAGGTGRGEAGAAGPGTGEAGAAGPGTGEVGTSGTAAGEIAGDPGPDDRGTVDDGSSPGGAAAGGGPARAAVLDRIRAALGADRGRPVEVPRGYRRGLYGAGAPAAVFAERVEDYRATVTRVPADGVRAAVEAALAARGVRRIAIAPGLDPAWRPADPAVELLDDDPPLTVAALDGLDGALTGCAVGIAETGTIVLDGSPACGRRALTLVPDYHLCVVRVDQVVGGVPEAIAALDPARPLTFVSGPSATSDIELERVEGVHGPRTLAVLLVE